MNASSYRFSEVNKENSKKSALTQRLPPRRVTARIRLCLSSAPSCVSKAFRERQLDILSDVFPFPLAPSLLFLPIVVMHVTLWRFVGLVFFLRPCLFFQCL